MHMGWLGLTEEYYQLAYFGSCTDTDTKPYVVISQVQYSQRISEDTSRWFKAHQRAE